MSKITTVKEAFKSLGRRQKKSDSVEHTVYTVIEAINKEFNGGKEWKADFGDSSQWKYYIWWRYVKGSGFRFDYAIHVWAFTYSYVGPRLSFVSYEAAKHFGTTEEFVALINKMWA